MDEFQRFVARLDYPMFVLTASAGGERSGCLVGFASQCSIDPARFAVWVSDKNHTFDVARRAGVVAVHAPAADQRALAELFGGETGDEVDKLAQTDWHEGPEGVPLVDGCANRFVGRILDRFAFGDHVGHLLEPVAVEYGTQGEEFTFHRAQHIRPGHPP